MRQGKPARHYSQAGRLHCIIRLLEMRRGMTLDDLAAECGVDRRTIRRDLNAVEEAGYALTCQWQQGKKVFSFLTRSRSIPPVSLTLNQLMSLYLLRSLGVHLAGTPFLAEIDDLFRTITSILPDRYAAHLERIARVSLPRLHGQRDYTLAAPHFGGLQRALLHQYRLRLEYAKDGGTTSQSYELDPYTLVFHRAGIYLLGYAHNRGGMRLFALERIRGLDVGRQRFELPEDYEPEQYFSHAFGLVNDAPLQVRVRFSPAVAHAVRDRIWRPGQCVEEDREGGVVLSFQASGERELVSWVLSYGDQAEVLEPASLRAEVAGRIEALSRLYRNGTPGRAGERDGRPDASSAPAMEGSHG